MFANNGESGPPCGVPSLSSHAAEFYLMQLDDLRALLLLASSPLHPASLLVCVPAAKSSLPVLSAYSLRISLTFSYGWRHRPRRAPFIPIVSLPAKHTSAAFTPL